MGPREVSWGKEAERGRSHGPREVGRGEEPEAGKREELWAQRGGKREGAMGLERREEGRSHGRERRAGRKNYAPRKAGRGEELWAQRGGKRGEAVGPERQTQVILRSTY